MILRVLHNAKGLGGCNFYNTAGNVNQVGCLSRVEIGTHNTVLFHP